MKRRHDQGQHTILCSNDPSDKGQCNGCPACSGNTPIPDTTNYNGPFSWYVQKDTQNPGMYIYCGKADNAPGCSGGKILGSIRNSIPPGNTISGSAKGTTDQTRCRGSVLVWLYRSSSFRGVS
jgi:hypothetical protein